MKRAASDNTDISAGDLWPFWLKVKSLLVVNSFLREEAAVAILAQGQRLDHTWAPGNIIRCVSLLSSLSSPDKAQIHDPPKKNREHNN